jgi:hypothetical protein
MSDADRPDAMTSDELYAQAVNAWERGDKRASGILINQVLKLDLSHEGAWKLLYDQYGAGKSFEEFQRAFTEKYFPEGVAAPLSKDPYVSPAPQPVAAQPVAEPAEMAAPVSTPVEKETSPSGEPRQQRNVLPFIIGGTLVLLLCVVVALILYTVYSEGKLSIPLVAGKASPIVAAGSVSATTEETKPAATSAAISGAAERTPVASESATVTPSAPTAPSEAGATPAAEPNSDLPEGLSTGFWVMTIPGLEGTAPYGFFRDNKLSFVAAPGSYHKTGDSIVETCFLGKYIEGADGCVTITVSSIVSPTNVQVQLSSAQMPSKAATMQKLFDDTSTGDLAKDVVGTWVGDSQDSFGIFMGHPSGQSYELVFDENGNVTDSDKGDSTYTISGDHLSMFGSTYLVANMGKVMYLWSESDVKDIMVLLRK